MFAHFIRNFWFVNLIRSSSIYIHSIFFPVSNTRWIICISTCVSYLKEQCLQVVSTKERNKKKKAVCYIITSWTSSKKSVISHDIFYYTMSLSRIDRLPIELLHDIFDYLFVHDIFYSFSSLSDHLDSILADYCHYLLNFHSVLKSKFDLLCQHIRPHQVISIILSHDNDTSNQSNLFFSHFKLEQFIYL